MEGRTRVITLVLAYAPIGAPWLSVGAARGVSARDADFVRSIDGAAVATGDFIE